MRKCSFLVVATCLAALTLTGVAQAASFAVEKYPATVTGKQFGVTKTGEGTILGFEAGLMTECGTAGFTTELSGASSTLTAESSVIGCNAFGVTAEVQNNGCEYVLHAGSGSEDAFTGTMDIVCPGGNAIVITGSTCEIQIGSQEGLGSVSYENATSAFPKPEVVANFEISGGGGFTYTKVKDGFLCPLSGTGVKTGGVFAGALKISGQSGGAVGVSIK